MPEQDTLRATKLRGRLIFLAVGALALYVILPQIGDFKESFSTVKGANWLLLLGALGFSLLTFFAAAGTYCLLALRPLRYLKTVFAQIAIMFVNRLLPAGIGGIGGNYVYLRKAQHTLPQAASVVTVNNALGIAGHFLLLIPLVIMFHNQLPGFQDNTLQNGLLFAIAIIVLCALIVLFMVTRKGRALTKITAIVTQLITYRHQPKKITGAIGTSVALTFCNILCLWFCMQALGVDLSFVSTLLVFTTGMIIGNATPTPGGLGGFEAGLVGGMIAYDISSSTALAVALTYRLITYWLSLALGSVAFVICRHKKIL